MSPPNLQQINSTTLGTSMPSVILPSGEKIQTGTVGALLVNIKRYDALSPTREQSDADNDEVKALEEAMRASIPTLRRVGMFGLFTPEEWIQGTESAGRKFVGRVAREVMEAEG